jgi:spermidine/putrescine ABC transporter ATP-binding subunit
MATEMDIALEGIGKRYGKDLALKPLDLQVPPGELLALLGPSGCGKTTLLRLIAGLIEPSQGKIEIRGRDVTHVPAHRRDVGLVFQNYALFPHMTVWQNVAFGLRMRGMFKADIRRIVDETLEVVRLGPLGGRLPTELSGGQQQRVAVARALVLKPAVLLLDEPFAALDKALRDQMQIELRNLQRRLNITSIFVTHDQDEALTISDKIAVMNAGRIEQIDSAKSVFETPKTEFVLGFIGQSNKFDGRVEEANANYATVAVRDWRIKVVNPSQGLSAGDKLTVAVRPGKMSLSREAPAADQNAIEGTIIDTLYLGTSTQYYVETGGLRTEVHRQNTDSSSAEQNFTIGDRVWITWLPQSTLLFAR